MTGPVRAMLARAMRRPQHLVLASMFLGALGVLAASTHASDPLATQVERWSKYLQSNTSTDEMWLQVKEGSVPAMARVEAAMKDGQRLLALQRLAAVEPNLASSQYLASLPADARTSDSAFEAAWKSAGQELGSDLKAPSPSAFDGVAPAAVRGIGEAATLRPVTASDVKDVVRHVERANKLIAGQSIQGHSQLRALLDDAFDVDPVARRRRGRAARRLGTPRAGAGVRAARRGPAAAHERRARRLRARHRHHDPDRRSGAHGRARARVAHQRLSRVQGEGRCRGDGPDGF